MTKAKEELNIIVNELKGVLDEHSDPKVSAVERIHLLSSTFRKKLSDGRTFHNHGPYRTKFYTDVINIADEVSWNFFAHDACFLMLLEYVCDILLSTSSKRLQSPPYSLRQHPGGR
jgi:hypothetical protein